jgi:plasmid stabilization system protein ParE
MRLRFTPRAIENLTELADYIRAQNPVGARHVQADILDSLCTVVVFPKIGRRQTLEGVRKLVSRKYSYLIYYTLDEEAGDIVILSVKHPARERDHNDM